MRSKLLVPIVLAMVAIGVWIAFESSAPSVGRASELGGVAQDAADSRVEAPSDAELDPMAREAAVDLEDVVQDESEESATRSEAPQVSAVVARSSRASTGTLVVRAAESCDCGALRSVDVRVASDTRYAQGALSDSSRGLEFELTPGKYSLGLSSAGHEPALVSDIEIRAGESIEPPAVRLSAGSARIVGSVRPGSSAWLIAAVELIGAGRHPCPRCGDTDRLAGREDAAWMRSEPCAACGFARERSKRALSADGRFEFANLAGGCYTLRIVDNNGNALIDEQSVEVRTGGVATIVLDTPFPRMVEIEMFDVDGASLSDEWSRRLVPQEEDDELEIVEFESPGPMPVQLELSTDDRVIARAKFVPPLPFGYGGGSAIGVSHRIACGVTRKAIRDRERSADDVLIPPSVASHFESQQLRCDLGENGIAMLYPVVASRLELRVAVESFSADVVVPASPDTTRVRVRLSATGDGEQPASLLALEQQRAAGRADR